VSDFTPVAVPGTSFTFQAGGPISGGDLVAMSGPSTVVRVSSAAALAYVGVAGPDGVSGGKITIHVAKMILDSVAEGAIAPGDQLVTSAVAGRHVRTMPASAVNVDVGAAFAQAAINTAINTSVNTAANNARAIIGTAVSPATDNTVVRWVQR
jgi:hypothetical protein